MEANKETTVMVMSRDRELFEAVLSPQGEVMEVGPVLDDVHLPVCLTGDGGVSAETVTRWLSKRGIPGKRDGWEEVRETFPELGHAKHRFSLSDPYWLRYDDSETWEEGNFFTRAYETDFGRASFAPWTVRRERLSEESPDETTNGVLKKRWIQPLAQKGDYTSCLIKAAFPAARQDPVSEVLASMMLDQLNVLPHVTYELCVDGLGFCSRCENFVTEGTEYVPASHVYYLRNREEHMSRLGHMVKMSEESGVADAEDFLLKMVAVDAAIGNTDRNLGNFGFLRDVETGRITGFAPLFDCGTAFYWGEGQKIDSRIFADDEAWAIKYARQRGMKKPTLDKMLALITSYPMLSVQEKDRLKNEMTETTERVFAKPKPMSCAERFPGRGEECWH